MRFMNEDLASIRKRVDDQTEALRKRSERWSRHQEEAEAEEEAQTERIAKRVEFLAKGLNKRLAEILETWKGVCEIVGKPEGVKIIADENSSITADEFNDEFLSDQVGDYTEICRLLETGEIILRPADFGTIFTYSTDEGSIGAWLDATVGAPSGSSPSHRWYFVNLSDDASSYVEEYLGWLGSDEDDEIIESVSDLKPLIDELENAVETWAENELNDNEQKVIRKRG